MSARVRASTAGRPGVLAAGLGEELAAWLAVALSDATVQVAETGDEALGALERHRWSLLVLDDRLSGPSAREVLSLARHGLGLVDLPVIYCLEKGLDGDLPARLVGKLGVRQLLFHPLDRAELTRHAAAILGLPFHPLADQGSPLQQQAHAAIAAVWERFKGANLGRLEVVEQAIRTLLEGRLDDGLRRQAEAAAHKLAGALGTFGFAEATQLARGLEQGLALGRTPDRSRGLALAQLAARLRRQMEQAPPGSSPEPAAGDERPVLLVVVDDEELAGRLAAEATARGIRTTLVSNPTATRETIVRERPDVVLLDLAVRDATGDALALLADLSARTPPVPVLVLADREGLADRVEVARLGGRGFLQKPVSAPQVLDAVGQVLQRMRAATARVMAVDDDPQVLEMLGVLLKPRGIELIGVDDPLRFWETLEESSPDLLLLDVNMPHLSGVELCRVVRNDPRWGGLPVLFLTAETDSDTVLRVFAAGADDYVPKPFVGPELLARIGGRLARAQLYRSMAETDPLTGLANRRKADQVMTQFLRLARRHGQPFCVAVLDVDHFKQVNDLYGHAAGDRVLRRLGELLLRSFRGEDVVSRWGGEEFCLGMYAMTRDDGVHRVAEVLEALRAEDFLVADGSRFTVTFSAGVAEYPRDGGDLQALYRAADDALYLAKAEGRDRVLPAGCSADPGRAEAPDVVLVGGSETLAEPLLRALATRGYRSRWLPAAREAERLLGGPEPSLAPRVVLLDGALARRQRLALLRRLASDGSAGRPRTIVLAPRRSDADEQAARALGAFDWLAEPVGLPLLLERLRRALKD